MKAKKDKRQRSEQIEQVSAGLRDMLGISQWRKEHPKATWAEIEAAIDEQINQVRAQLIEDVVQMGESDQWSELPEEERPKCATCGKPLWARGKQTRYLQTTGGEAVELTRMYRAGSACGMGGRGGASQAGRAPGGCGSRQASAQWGWSDGASGRRRVGRASRHWRSGR